MSDVMREYAKALFMLASENESAENYGKALDAVLCAFSENDGYAEFLSSPGIPLSERLSALDSAFSDFLPKDVMSFIKILCEKRYIKDFEKCVEEYNSLLAEVSKVSTAKVISAVALSKDEEQALKNKLEEISGHTILLECMVDKSILGGLIVEIDGKIADASIARHLKDVKDVMFK